VKSITYQDTIIPPLPACLGGHDPEARAEAGVKRWEPVTPEPELLAIAAPEPPSHRARVKGPHLRVVRKRYARNKTGVVGISLANRRAPDGRVARRLVVNLGSTNRAFNVETLGPNEAWRRAVMLRAEHEAKVARANAMILKAREKAEARAA
jgi:hypothetical protein